MSKLKKLCIVCTNYKTEKTTFHKNNCYNEECSLWHWRIIRTSGTRANEDLDYDNIIKRAETCEDFEYTDKEKINKCTYCNQLKYAVSENGENLCCEKKE